MSSSILHAHQYETVRRMLEDPTLDLLFWWKMGTGKTRGACACALALIETGAVTRVIVLCPNSTKNQWTSEMARTFGEKRMSRMAGRIRIECSVGFLNAVAGGDKTHLKNIKSTLLVVDEAHEYRNARAGGTGTRAQAFVEVARKAGRKILLTGTPIFDKPTDIVPLAAALDRSLCISRPEAMLEAALQSLRGKISWHRGGEAITVSSEGFEVKEEVVTIPMTPHFQEWYQKCELDNARRTADQGVRPKNMQAFMIGVRQDINGSHGQVSPKMTWLLKRMPSWIRERKKVIVVSGFIEKGLDLIESALSGVIQCYRISGKDLLGKDISQKARADMVDGFNRFDVNEHGRGAVMLVAPCGGVGVHIPADIVVHFEPCWNQSETDQRSARAVREVRKAKEIYHLICAKVPELSNELSKQSADEYIRDLAAKKLKECKDAERDLRKIAEGVVEPVVVEMSPPRSSPPPVGSKRDIWEMMRDDGIPDARISDYLNEIMFATSSALNAPGVRTA